MTEVFQEAALQMALQSALEKGVALLTNFPLHGDTVPHLPSDHFAGHMVKEMLMKGTVTGIQATEGILSDHHKDVTEAHQGTGALPDTEAGGVAAGALIAPVMGIAAAAQYVVLAR